MPTYDEWKIENWDRAHKETNVSALTGTALGGHLNTLCAVDFFIPETVLLCIGVGTGGWVAEAAERVKEVWAIDISKVAARRMPRGVTFVQFPEQLPSNKFTLALSLWVAPHMSNHDLEVQIRHVVRSLVPNGVFAVHYKQPMNDDDPIDNREGASDEWIVARRAGMLRRQGHFEAMVRWGGGKVVGYPGEIVSQFYGIREMAAHISPANRGNSFQLKRSQL